MSHKPTDIQIVKGILDEIEGQPNQLKAYWTVLILRKRIRQRARNRASDDANQAAVRIIGEPTEKE